MTITLPTFDRLAALRGALSTCAIEGNGLARDCLETLRRIEAGETVGPMYVKRFVRLANELGFECKVEGE